VPAVSIITPAWNAAAFLRETIESVRAQTFRDWELLVIDDGSTDDTVDIVRSYATDEPRIRLLCQANAGPSAARNRAMREAHGECFAFLDSDDAWAPRFLEAQLAVLAAHPETSLVTGTAWNRGGPFDGEPTRPFRPGWPVLPLEEIIVDETSVFIMTVFRRRVFDTIGGFDETQWRSEDYDFWIRAAQAGFVFRRHPQPLAWYRVRGNSLSHNAAPMLEGILHSYRKARARASANAPEAPVLDAQIARFEAELLLEQGKQALERGDYPAAADRLSMLRRRGGGRLVAVAAWLARHAPRAAAAAYRLRHWRPHPFNVRKLDGFRLSSSSIAAPGAIAASTVAGSLQASGPRRR
jgi:glycosyltransferase involved in cell wall biosynthesis